MDESHAPESQMTQPTDHEFRHFFELMEPRLRQALVATYGSDRGREAAAEALAYAWEHWDDLSRVQNVGGYLYRVGQSRTRHAKVGTLFVRSPDSDIWFEPTLAEGLAEMTDSQRTAVVLVHGFSWTLREVAEFTGVHVSTVQTHVERGLKKLRAHLKVTNA